MSSIDALDLPIQFFAVGTALGMLAALVRHRRTGEIDHWPVHVAICALAMFGLGLLISTAATLF
jgi:peptidoglycan/LPS O-acetylase OafA/YrhL